MVAGGVLTVAKNSGAIKILQLSNSAFSPEYQAVLDRATALGFNLPSTNNKHRQDNLVRQLKAAGIWYKLDALRVFKYAGSLNFSTIDWINPASTIGTNVNGPVLDDQLGIKSDGVSSYASMNGFITDGSGNYKLGDASFFGLISNPVQIPLTPNTYVGYWGRGGSGNDSHLIRFNSNGITKETSCMINNGTFATFGSTEVYLTKPGIQMSQNYSPAGRNRLWVNGLMVYNPAITGIVMGTGTWLIGKSPITSCYCTDGIGLFGLGSALWGLEATLNTICKNFDAS